MNNHSVRIQYVHEVTTSINVALTLVALYFIDLDPRSALFEMDRSISRYLGLLPDFKVPKDNFTYGYFAFFIPAIVLAICLWLMFRWSVRTRLTREFLKSVAGIWALAGAPLWWLLSTYDASQGYGLSLLGEIPFYEVIMILAFGIIYLSEKWSIPDFVVLLFLVLHYGFWFGEFGSRVYFCGYGGPLASTAGLCAGLTWISYLRGLREMTDAV